MNSIVDELKKAERAACADRLHELLDYVEQVIKLDERPAFKLSEYRLGTQNFIFPEHELQGLPGVTRDSTGDDGPIWLTVDRLKKSPPPKPPEEAREWLAISPDPDKAPEILPFLLKTVAKAECDQLVAAGKVRAEDCAESMSAKNPGQFDIRLRIEDYTQSSQEAQQYVTGPWIAWAVAERPRRRTIAMYQRLFEIIQLTEMGVADQPVELVWGMGHSNWLRDGTLIDLPLIECLVEAEIDERSSGKIRVRPRQARPTANLRPYDQLHIDGVSAAIDAA